jgi:hypothetical protein
MLIVTVGVTAACSSTVPTTPVPTPQPTPVPTATPDPHLIAPAKADDVFLGLRAAGLAITLNTANTGGAGRDPVKEIEATYDGWPLSIGQYRSAATLEAATGWKAGVFPGIHEAPIEFIGLNILIRWGPISSKPTPKMPDGRQVDSAERLRAALDRLISPLRSRTLVTLPGASVTTSPGSAASAAPSTRATAKP